MPDSSGTGVYFFIPASSDGWLKLSLTCRMQVERLTVPAYGAEKTGNE